MRVFLSSLFLLFALNFNAQAASQPVEGQVVDIICVEFDPFVVGDACVTYIVTEEGEKLGLYYHEYDLYDYIGGESEGHVGKFVSATQCSKINEHRKISILKDYDSSYFYLECSVNGFSFVEDESSDLTNMYWFAELNDFGSFYPGFGKHGFSSENVTDDRPLFPESLKKELKRLETEAYKDWFDYVDGGGLSYYSEKEQKYFKKNPKKFLDVPFLNTIEGVYKVYRNGRHIGYVISLNRNVRGQIIEDGSGVDLFTDKDLNPLTFNEWDA